MFYSMNLRYAEGTVDGGRGEIKAREANFGVGAQTGEIEAGKSPRQPLLRFR